MTLTTRASGAGARRRNGLHSVPPITGHPSRLPSAPGTSIPTATRRRSGSADPGLAVTTRPEPDRNVLLLHGELDVATAPRLRSLDELRAVDPRPLVLDCSRITFVDVVGLRALLDLLERGPRDRLANIPAPMAKLLRLVDRDDVLRVRARHAIAIATFAGVDVVSAARVAEVFRAANHEGCSYDLVTVPFEPTSCVGPPSDASWHYVIMPPLEAWLGLSETLPITRWARRLVQSSERVLGIGTGIFLLAATGCLDDHRVAAGPLEPPLSAAAPHAEVQREMTAVDRSIETAADADGAVTLCRAAIEMDYGHEIASRVDERIHRSGHGRGRGRSRARWSS